MPPKPKASTKDEEKVPVQPSILISRPDDLEGGEETEIAAQITVPEEGGWGWVVVAASFISIFVLDGVAFTFGAVFGDITEELQMEQSVVAIISSLTLAMYFTCGPFTSAMINRFGFRAIIMLGSIIVTMSLFCTCVCTSYAAICMFYGVFAGLGYCFINMSASLVVGFYFERLRSIALAISTTGSSAGVMVLYPFNVYIVKLAGWRTLTLLHSAFFGIIFFLGMTFRPLLSLTVTTTTTDDRTKTVTFLPSLKSVHGATPSTPPIRMEGVILPTATEKMFNAVSNRNFPTAAAIVHEGIPVPDPNQAGSSAPMASKLTLTAHVPRGGISQRQLKNVQSMISRSNVHDETRRRTVEVTVQIDQPVKKRSCWGRLCHWEEHVPESRPMYRDDVFYEGQLDKLPAYQKSMMNTTDETRTGLEYQLAVSRAVTTIDLQERRRGVFTTAARRILATMMDPKLLKRRSFLFFSSSSFLYYLGYLVPYVFLQERNKHAGIDENTCTWFVSVVGFGNVIGRFILSGLALKFNAIKIHTSANIIAGIATILSDLSFNMYYQFTYSCIFGMSVVGTCLRSLALVQLYGLDKLTNATGMVLLFSGVGCSLCTPVASILKGMFGYGVAFYASGFCVFLSGLCLIPVQSLCNKENK